MTLKSFRNFVVSTFCVLGLSGCLQGPVSQSLPELTFAHLPAYGVPTQHIDVAVSYVAPLAAPNVEHRVPLSPKAALKVWSNDRLNAVGGDAAATFTIIDASVKEYALDTDGNFTAYFTDEQALKYEAVAEATLSFSKNDSSAKGQAQARVSRSVTVPENATINERELALFNLVDGLMKDFDARMSASIAQHLGTWVQP